MTGKLSPGDVAVEHTQKQLGDIQEGVIASAPAEELAQYLAGCTGRCLSRLVPGARFQLRLEVGKYLGKFPALPLPNNDARNYRSPSSGQPCAPKDCLPGVRGAFLSS